MEKVSGRKCDCTYDCTCRWNCKCCFLCSCCRWHAKVCPFRTSRSFFVPNSVTNCGVHCTNLHACFCTLCANKKCTLCKKKHPSPSLLHYIKCKEYMLKWKREREREAVAVTETATKKQSHVGIRACTNRTRSHYSLHFAKTVTRSLLFHFSSIFSVFSLPFLFHSPFKNEC